jgi:glycosyltransferase involved in cell wall biosynthesis
MSGFSITHLVRHGRESLRDWAKFDPWCAGLASRALAAAGRLARQPERALAYLVVAARGCPDPARRQALEAELRQRAAALDPAALDWDRVCASPTDRRDVPKGLILKPPVSPAEKGVLYVTFEDQWLRLLRHAPARAIAEQYDLVLGPTWSPPHDVPLLVATRLWPGPLYTLLSNLDDAAIMRRLADKLVPIPLLSSSWANPDTYREYLGAAKDYDVIMLANFSPYKRHWLFFQMLRGLPRRYRVLLMGVPLGGRTEQALRDEARAYGVHDRFELRTRLSDGAIAGGLCRSRTSLIFSGQEGACIAVAESLFADTPVGLFHDARVGSKAFINPSTGRLLTRRNLAAQVQDFIETSASYRPRQWALENITCRHSHAVLNGHLREDAVRRGRPWTRDVLPFYQNALVGYLCAADAREAAPWYDDFERAFGVRLGAPAGRTPAVTTNTPEPHPTLGAPCSGS